MLGVVRNRSVCPGRDLGELVGMLEDRWRRYVALSALERARVDERRWVATPEAHDILTHFLLTGGFIDEPLCRRKPPPDIPPIHKPGFQ